MATIKSLDEYTMREIQRMLRWWRAWFPGGGDPKRKGHPQPRSLIAKTQTGGVPARVTTTPGTADVDLWDFDAEGEMYARTDAQGNQVTVEATNVWGGVVGAAGGVVITLKEHVSGRLVIDGEDCSVES